MPTKSPSKNGPKVKAAAWGSKGTLYAIVDRQGKRSVNVIRSGRVVDVQPCVAKGTRIIAFPNGEILTMNRDGKGKLLSGDGKARSADIEMDVNELVLCHGVAWVAGGRGRQLARFDPTTAEWSGAGLRAATIPLLPLAQERDDVRTIIEGKNGPIVAVQANGYHRVLVMEYDGIDWKLRADLKDRCNGLARCPDTDVVYSVGDSAYSISPKGTIRRLGEAANMGLWSAAWGRGTILTSSLWNVSALDPETGKQTTLLDPKHGQVPDNHSLFVAGDRIAFVCDNRLFVSTTKQFQPIVME